MENDIWLALILLFLVVVFFPGLYKLITKKPPRRYIGVSFSEIKYTEVTFQNNIQKLNLGGMLFIPEGKGPFAAVAIIYGSGTSMRENRWYLTLCQVLQMNDIAVLLPDKR